MTALPWLSSEPFVATPPVLGTRLFSFIFQHWYHHFLVAQLTFQLEVITTLQLRLSDGSQEQLNSKVVHTRCFKRMNRHFCWQLKCPYHTTIASRQFGIPSAYWLWNDSMQRSVMLFLLSLGRIQFIWSEILFIFSDSIIFPSHTSNI